MSKTKRNGGYVLVDFTGVNLTTIDSAQTPVNPVYEPIITAIKNNKPIYVMNLAVSDGGAVVAPFNVPFFDTGELSANGIFSTFHVSVLFTNEGDQVVISQA